MCCALINKANEWLLIMIFKIILAQVLDLGHRHKMKLQNSGKALPWSIRHYSDFVNIGYIKKNLYNFIQYNSTQEINVDHCS